MFKWKAPKIEPSEEELKRNIPDLTSEYFQSPYWYIKGYVYFVYCSAMIIKARCDGKEQINLYSIDRPSDYDSFSLKILEIKDGYVYFRQENKYTYRSDWQYESDETTTYYRVKTDKTMELQEISWSKTGTYYGGGEFENGSDYYDSPKIVKNPAKKAF
jgi:hypothetical protein